MPTSLSLMMSEVVDLSQGADEYRSHVRLAVDPLFSDDKIGLALIDAHEEARYDDGAG